LTKGINTADKHTDITLQEEEEEDEGEDEGEEETERESSQRTVLLVQEVEQMLKRDRCLKYWVISIVVILSLVAFGVTLLSMQGGCSRDCSS